MKKILHRWLLFVSLSTTLGAKKPDLPLCPTHPQYFPQDLPMHCRMPRNIDPSQFPGLPQYPTLPPLPQSFYQSPSPDKQPPPIPIHIPPSFQGMPGGMPMGGPMVGPMPGMPGAMPMPMPMPGGSPHKLPVIVMPFYSPDNPSKKKPDRNHHKKKPSRDKKKKHFHDSSESCSGEISSGSDYDSNDSSEHGFWKGRRKARRKMTRRFNRRHNKIRRKEAGKKKDLLTPILQYVTKDGYVIFEKQISKNEAKDWLKPKPEMNETVTNKAEENINRFRPNDIKSAEDFFREDDADIESIERRKDAEIEITTKRGRRFHPN